MSQYTLWNEEFGVEYIRRYAQDGLCDSEIARKIGIAPKTFYKWKKKYPEVEEALRLGRINSDIEVVRAIYRKATGYKVKVNKTVKLKRSDFDPETGKKIRDYEELATAVDENYIPADVRAGMFWLKSRQPERWREGVFDDISNGETAGVVELPSPDTIDAYYEEGDGENQKSDVL